MAYYKVTQHPKEDPVVRDVQSKLNSIRLNYHCNWPYLDTDGKYGPQTALAVKGFQQYRNISPASGELGDTTIGYINAMYDTLPKIGPASPAAFAPKPQNSATHPMGSVFDAFMGVIENVTTIVRDEIEYATQLGHCDAKAITNHFRTSMGRLDPKLKQLQDAFANNKYARQMLGQLKGEAAVLPRQPKSFSDTVQIRNNQRQTSRYQMMQKGSSNTAKKVSIEYVNILKKYDIVSKVTDKLKEMGITGEIKLTGQKSLKIKAGGVFLLWSVKDVLWDLIQVNRWGDEDWKQELTDDCYDFLDQFIIGIIAVAIAQAVAAGVIAALGLTVSGGVVIVIVAVAAIFIGFLLTWLFSSLVAKFTNDPEGNTSFSKFLWEGSVTQVLSAVYAIH